MTAQVAIEKETETEIRQLANIVKKALQDYRKYLPKEQIQVETWVLRRLVNNSYRGIEVNFTFLGNKLKNSHHFKPSEDSGVRQLSFIYHDLMVTIEKPTGEKIDLVFRIHDLRTIEYYKPNTFYIEWIYYGKVEFKEYHTYY